SGKQFKCGHCGWQGDADFNGAKHIAAMGASVNRPRGPWLSCQITAGPALSLSSASGSLQLERYGGRGSPYGKLRTV
ncbi:MAG: hypothetical protein ACK4WO_04850, partial [Thermosynechococcus sp.]